MPITAPAFLEYSDAEHRYFADGKEMPSVTTILDAAGLISSFCKDEEARYRGSKVHEFTATDDVAPLDLRKVPVDLRGYLKAWRAYRLVSGFMPALIEHRVDSIQYGYSGRFDRLGIRNGQPLLTLLDIKTSKTGAIAQYVRFQLAAYALAHDPHKVFDRMAVSLKPDGTYNCHCYTAGSYLADRAEWLQILGKVKQEGK